tara:strand:- start:339 stop:686 length:348 start_codon:yes stop_codon:yes gene_type:complete
MVDRVLRRSGGVVVDRLRGDARDLHDAAYRDWYSKIEKRSGASQAGLSYAIRIPDPKTVESYVANSAPYVWFIRYPWPENNVYIYRDLLIKPAKRRAKKMATDLGEELRKLAGRG